jgi:plasmid stabilization system protein ParE
MRRIRVLQEAAEELEEAVAWYELQRNGLGAELARAVDAALDVLESPTAPVVAIPGRAGTRGLKRLILRRFPFDVIVRQNNDEVVIIAFAHQSRRPGYWRSRR